VRIGAIPFISSWLSRFLLSAPVVLPTDPLAIVGGRFVIGSRSWPLDGRVKPTISLNEHRQVTLVCGHRAFALGPVVQTWADPRGPQYSFTPDAGDVLIFTQQHSRWSWPVLPHINILGGASPRWQRRSYERLRWTKTTGAKLDMVWRDRQDYYRGSGWSDQNAHKLVRVAIHDGKPKQI
jgi:hypothetical protein